MTLEKLEYRLCYVRAPWAYFTTQELKDQWGDDWNDMPYEHNAGEPYRPGLDDVRAGKNWQILKVAWDGPFEEPRDGHVNSPWSVKAINSGAVPWLRVVPSQEGLSDVVQIFAGVTLEKFCSLINEGGGCVYLPAAGAVQSVEEAMNPFVNLYHLVPMETRMPHVIWTGEVFYDGQKRMGRVVRCPDDGGDLVFEVDLGHHDAMMQTIWKRSEEGAFREFLIHCGNVLASTRKAD